MTAEPLQLALRLTREAARIMTEPGSAGLRVMLRQLARLVASLPDVKGALVIALDGEALPLAYGSHHLQLRGPSSQLEALSGLHEAIAEELQKTSWIEVDSSLFTPTAGTLLALPVQGHSAPQGLVLLSCRDSRLVGPTLDALVASGEVFAAAIQAAVRTDAWTRIEQMQKLAQEEFVRPKPDLSGLVRQLAQLFEAGVVTLLLKSREELRLSVSTDSLLGSEKPVSYQSGEGLTGHVFSTGQALRLRRSSDAEEVFRITGLERKCAKHPEHDGQGLISGQFLAVPLRSDHQVLGVLRMSRRGSSMRFTEGDEKSLQFFADLLGIYLAGWLELLLTQSILGSTSEAIAVSLRERSEDGETWPKIILTNPGTTDLLGYSKEELCGGMDARSIYAPGAYDQIHDGLEEALSRASERGMSEYGPVEVSLKHKNGTIHPVEISYRILANNLVQPPTLFTIGISRDISERSKAEIIRRRFFDFLKEMRIVYFRADREGRTLESTPAESEMTGYPQEELTGLVRDRLYVDPTERAKVLQKLRDLGGRLSAQVLKFKRKDGSIFWIEADVLLLKDAEGREDGIEGFYKDVSQRLHLQGFLDADTHRVLEDEELFLKLKQHEEFHLDYMMSMGHQLQTPLSSLVENLRNVQQGLINSKNLGERLPYIIGQAVVCTRLVRNLSYMDKVLRAEPFQREPVSIAKLAIETKIDFLPLLQEKRLELTIDDANLDRYLKVQGHRDMLRQVIVNLVDNAIKYSTPRSTISIRAQEWPQGAVFEISNQGLSIPEELREKIFERGHRTKQAKALVPHGTGLGLWLVRKILEAHGATIRCTEVMEQEQRRVVFRIIFPHPVPTRRAT